MVSSMTVSVINVMLQMVASFYQVPPPQTRVKLQSEWSTEYDYVVVGAGSAGAVVAARLTELINQQVVVLEAGGTENLVSDVPLFGPFLQGTEMDWQYKTEPQKYSCFGMEGNRSNWPRGKVLGGSSVLNWMIYMRGNARDFDLWEKMGAKGWSWRDVLPYFLKAENNTDPRFLGDPFHNQGGPLTVSTPNSPAEASKAFPAAGLYLGYSNTRDVNGPIQSGFVNNQATTRGGARCSTARAYLAPASRRFQNLDVVTNSLVTKILFNENRAIGVQFERAGLSYVIYARKEIIISGGTINSPQLLMLSGIGPRQDLEALGIPVVKDLPGVGQNLQDHIMAGGIHFSVDPGTSLVFPLAINKMNTDSFYGLQRGPYTSLSGVDALALTNTKYANLTDDWPDIEIQQSLGVISLVTAKNMGLTNQLSSVYLPYQFIDAYTLLIELLRPKSTGYIKLRTADPHDHPILEPNYLSDERDLLVIVEGMKTALAAGLSPPMKQINSQLINITIPGCEAYKMWSTQYLACCARSFTATTYHQVGTCRMGDPKDPLTVVDPQLRVLGVQGLRVIDASVMPAIPSAHTNAVAIMIGEKGADMIKGKQLPSSNIRPTDKSFVDSQKQFSEENKVLESLRGPEDPSSDEPTERLGLPQMDSPNSNFTG